MKRWILPVYWVLCLLATHSTLPKGAEPWLFADKVMHCLMYFILGGLLAWRLSSASAVSASRYFVAWLVLAAYGVFDELTQPYFGRSAEWLDWVADLVGSGSGIGLVGWVRARAQPA